MHYVDQKYILLVSPYLERWKDVGNGIYNFRCPLCGDSKQSRVKTRGYLFPIGDTVRYKCHNCGASLSLNDFVSSVSHSLGSEYRFEKFIEPKKRTKRQREQQTADKMKQMNDQLNQSTDRLKRVSKKPDILSQLERLLDLDPDHPAREYVDSRMIPNRMQERLYYTPDLNRVLRTLDRYKDRLLKQSVASIVMPFITVENEVTHLQFRSVYDDATIRYMTIELIADREKVFNADAVDWSKPVWVFEGCFDAMMIPNSIAVAGVSFLSAVKYLDSLSTGGYTFVFDKDYENNYNVFYQFKKTVQQGYAVVLYDKTFKWKDANASIVGGWTPEQLETYFKSRKVSGLKAELGLTSFKHPPKKNNGAK